MLSQEESRRQGNNFVGTEHMLLGVVGQSENIAAKELKKRGLDIKIARKEVFDLTGRGDGFVSVEIPFTDRAKKCLEFSWDEARKLEHNYIAPEHLLLGMLRVDGSLAMTVLERLGIDSAELYHHVFAQMGGSNPQFDIDPAKNSPWYDLYSDQGFFDVLNFAQTCARSLDEEKIRVEHILVGLMEADESVAHKILLESGLALEGLKSRVAQSSIKGNGSPPNEMPLSDAANLWFVQAVLMAQLEKRKPNSADLLGVLFDKEKLRLLNTLKELGVDVEAVANRISKSGEEPLRADDTAFPDKGQGDSTEEARSDSDTPSENSEPDVSPPKPAQAATPAAWYSEKIGMLTPEVRQIFDCAIDECHVRNDNLLKPEQLLIGILAHGSSFAALLLSEFGLDLKKAKEVCASSEPTSLTKDFKIVVSPQSAKIVAKAELLTQLVGREKIESAQLLLALLSERDKHGLKKLFDHAGNLELLRTRILEQIANLD